MYIINEKTDRSFCDKVPNLYAEVRMKNEKKNISLYVLVFFSILFSLESLKLILKLYTNIKSFSKSQF